MASSNRFNFAKKALRNLPPAPSGKRSYYYDTAINGLVLQITDKGHKSFQVYRRVKGGQPKRITIGTFPDTTVEQAQRKALDILSSLAGGIDVNAVKKADKVRAITLGEVFDDYLKARKALKPGTIFDYNRVMREGFADWRDKPLASITADKVAIRHKELGKRSEARANLSMRLLRALWNFAQGEYQDEAGEPLIGARNPVKRLSHTKAWYKVDRRQQVIRPHELKPWFDAVEALGLDREVFRDYLLVLLLSGLRREEAAQLRCSDVDLTHRALTIPDPKNRQPHVLPLSDYLAEILRRRVAASPNGFVFPSTASKHGYIINPYKLMKRLGEQSGVAFDLHTLRRTFITIGESLDISPYTIKRLVNHKMNADVTSGYIVADVERLRRPMQEITNFLLRAAGRRSGAEIVSFGDVIQR